MKHLIIFCVILPLLLTNICYPQDTLSLEPAAMLPVTNVMYIENNVMISTSIQGHSQYLKIYNISNPSDPELIDSAFALGMRRGSPEHVNNSKITDAIIIDDIVIWCTMHDIGHPAKGEMIHGPITLWGRRIGDAEALWYFVLYEEDDDWYGWPGNMVLHENYLYLAGGAAGTVMFDMSDPADPGLVNVLNLENTNFFSRNTNIDESLLIYHSCFRVGQFLRLFDLSNPVEPELLGMYEVNQEHSPWNFAAGNAVYNGCVLYKNSSREDSSSILVLDIISDDAPREAAIIDLRRNLDRYSFYISDDCLFLNPDYGSYFDYYSLNQNFEISYLGTISLGIRFGGQFLVHDHKLIISSDYYGNPEAYEWEDPVTYIYDISPVSVPSPPALQPCGITLSAYPNPFNSTTTISYTIPNTGDVSVTLYDLDGRLMDNPVSGKRAAGSHSISWQASDFPAGIYFCQMKMGSVVETRKLVLMK